MDELHALLDELDKVKERTSEREISRRVNSVARGDLRVEAVGEVLAFSFCENYADKRGSWGTYFGPMMTWMAEDGTTHESPSLNEVNEGVINYWLMRSTVSANPIMKARYLGLVWDLSEAAVHRKPDHEVAVAYVHALIEAVDHDACKIPTEGIEKVSRAYRVAAALNNVEMIGKSIASAIALEDRVARDDLPGLWGFSFKLFVLGKCRHLSQAQQHKLLTDLESRLDRVVKCRDPWASELAGIPLASYYRRQKMEAEATRVVDVVGRCFEDTCEGLDAIQASSRLQHVHSIYLAYNMSEGVERVSKRIAEVGPAVVESMRVVSHSVEISKKELDEYFDDLTAGGLDSALHRIAWQFIPKRDQVERQLLDLARQHPVSFLFARTLQDHRGRPVATIGDIESDLDGHVLHHLTQCLHISAPLLRGALERASLLYGLTEDGLLSHILRSPLFEEARSSIIRRGVAAFLAQDYLPTVHILVPQAEAAVRRLVDLSGGASLKRNRVGGFQLKNLDELLREPAVDRCLGSDMCLYFRMLLTDQRGWNLRNDLCHGISPSNSFNSASADRVMHVMLCLSVVSAEPA